MFLLDMFLWFICAATRIAGVLKSHLLSTEQGGLTIVRRSSSRHKSESCPTPTDEQLDQISLDTEHLPAVDTPDACDKAALR